MRERLIEILNKKYDHFCDQCGVNKDSHYTENLADYLLDNGVVVPPCKVGSKVYKITRNQVKECEVTFVGISADERCSHFNFVENYADGTFYKSYSMVFDVIGKTVFLTREEAERALRKEDEGK